MASRRTDLHGAVQAFREELLERARAAEKFADSQESRRFDFVRVIAEEDRRNAERLDEILHGRRPTPEESTVTALPTFDPAFIDG